MARHRPLLHALLPLVAALAACKVDLPVPAGAQVSCGADADCPDGFVCRVTISRCVQPGSDAVAPQLVGSSLVVTPSRVGAGTPLVTVEFQVSEALAADPDAALRLSGAGAPARPLSVQSHDEVAHRYVLSYAPAPASDPEGDVSFVATFVDAAGNQGHVELPRVAVFDFTPPALAIGTGGAPVVSVTLTPPATSPLRDVAAVTAGTRLRVDFAAAEPLSGGAGSPVVTLGSGGSFLPLAQVSGNGLSFVFEAVVGAGFPEGQATLAAHLTDLAGNEADVALGTLQVRTRPPAAPAVATAGAVLFHRVPWGSEATGGAEAYYLRGLAGSVPAGALVVAYSAPTVVTAGGKLVGREIARTFADAAGGFGGDVGDAVPFQLFMGDAPDLYVAAVDDAGNVSDADGDPSNGAQASLVRDVAWTATMLGKIPGRVFPNPHAFEGRQVWTATLAQRGSKPAATPDDVGRLDGTQTSVRGAPHWARARRYGPLGYRAGVGLAHDPVRGCRVAFGGDSWDGCDTGFYCSQWESCHGSGWSLPGVDDPEGDGNPALASGLPLVFAGGRGTSVLHDGTALWEWDGASWRRLVMTDPEGDGNPGPRRDHAIAYDEARQRLVLFGGISGSTVLGDTWETDFRSWRRVCDTAPCSASVPPARWAHSMVYDPVRKVTLLVGGARLANGTSFDAATWTWNGSAWTSRCTTAPCVSSSPAQRRSAGLAFDASRGLAVVFGGITSVGTDGGTFEWNGTTWALRCTTAPCATSTPAARSRGSLYWDADRRRVVLFGGEVGSFGSVPECFSNWCGTEWEWNGSAWTQILAVPAGPPSVRDLTTAYDSIRDRVVLFGGRTNTGTYSSATWLWDGGQWSAASPIVVPTGRAEHGLAFVAGSGYAVLADGTNGSPLGSTYTWNGSNWTALAGGPSARTRAAVSARAPGGALLFGGEDGIGTALCDTWGLSGTTWTNLNLSNCSVNAPSARSGHAMVRATGFGPFAGGPVVLFGGAVDFNAANDVWTFGGSWTRSSAGGPASTTQPAPRTGHGLFFDTGRNRVLLWGGAPAAAVSNVNCVDDYGGLQCHDFWEWSGSAWTRVFPVDLRGQGNPDPGRLEAVAYDTTRQMGVGIESNTGAGATLDTWWWSGGPVDRPGQVMSVFFDAAEVLRPFDVLDVDVTWVGGGSGAPGGATTSGATVQIWDNTAWLPLVSSSTARPAAPETLHWSLSTDPLFGATPLAERQRFMVGDLRALHLALVPAAASGSADGFGEVSTDYAEVTVLYRLAAP